MIDNTKAQDAALHLIGMLSGTSDYIERLEAEGQRQLLKSTKLPVDMSGERDKFEALGFVFGEVDPNDELFVDAVLPEGWNRKETDHSMWTKIVDDRGFERVGVFYKAAFYDRRAHMNLMNVGRNVAYDAARSRLTLPWDQLSIEEVYEACRYLEDELNEITNADGKYERSTKEHLQRFKSLLAEGLAVEWLTRG